MATLKTSRTILVGFAVLVLVIAGIAVIKRDTIADLILRGGDVTLIDESARSSPQAKVALDFLGAFRTMDTDAMARVLTAEQIARVKQESERPSGDFQRMRTMMLGDLPADPAALRATIRTVQVHGDRAVVLAETKANSWFVQLARVDGAWKVSGF
jgi:hypothetical protein